MKMLRYDWKNYFVYPHNDSLSFRIHLRCWVWRGR